MEEKLKLWADVGRQGDGQSSGSLQTVLMEGASEQAEGAMRSGQEAGHGSQDRNSRAKAASPDVVRPGHVAHVVQVDMRVKDII